MSMGEIVKRLQMPFIWIPGQMPYHVTNKDKLQVTCPLKYKFYAHKVEANCPVFRTLVNVTKSKQALSWKSGFPNGVCGRYTTTHPGSCGWAAAVGASGRGLLAFRV